MRLILIRHGQTPNNVAGALDTAFPGAGLTDLGDAQAAALPGALADEDVSAIYASPLVRTQLTGDPLAAERGLEVYVREGLEEISAGALEMRSDDEAVQDYIGRLGRWMQRDLAHGVPGGKTGHDFYDRYDRAVTAIADEHGRDDTVVAFSHGAAIRVYTALVAQVDPEEAAGLWIHNTGMAMLEGHPDDGWELVRWSSEPLGGAHLNDTAAHDVTGDEVDEVVDPD